MTITITRTLTTDEQAAVEAAIGKQPRTVEEYLSARVDEIIASYAKQHRGSLLTEALAKAETDPAIKADLDAAVAKVAAAREAAKVEAVEAPIVPAVPK